MLGYSGSKIQETGQSSLMNVEGICAFSAFKKLYEEMTLLLGCITKPGNRLSDTSEAITR